MKKTTLILLSLFYVYIAQSQNDSTVICKHDIDFSTYIREKKVELFLSGRKVIGDSIYREVDEKKYLFLLKDCKGNALVEEYNSKGNKIGTYSFNSGGKLLEEYGLSEDPDNPGQMAWVLRKYYHASPEGFWYFYDEGGKLQDVKFYHFPYYDTDENKDVQITSMLKSFYTAYITTVANDTIDDFPVSIKSLQWDFCTYGLTQELPKIIEETERDPFLKAQDIHINVLKTLKIEPTDTENEYNVSYIDGYSKNAITISVRVKMSGMLYKIDAVW